MCGIAGYINFDGRDISAHVLAQMTEALRHRGPDDIGLRAFSMQRGCSQGLTSSNRGPVAGCEGGVGFTRLSILDLSAAGHQPMVNAEGDVILAFNGEIYNAFDYRADLETDGYRFTSKTDTEVVLHLYERYGLDGMLERVGDISKGMPRQRICDPAMLDSTLLFLVSPASVAVTGTVIKVDDGQGRR